MSVCQNKTKAVSAREKRKFLQASQTGEKSSPEGKTLRKDESPAESLHLNISRDTPVEDDSISLLAVDLE